MENVNEREEIDILDLLTKGEADRTKDKTVCLLIKELEVGNPSNTINYFLFLFLF